MSDVSIESQTFLIQFLFLFVVFLFQGIETFEVYFLLIGMDNSINNADSDQNINKFCPPCQPERRVNMYPERCRVLRPVLIVQAGFYQKLILAGRNIAEGDAVLLVDRIP